MTTLTQAAAPETSRRRLIVFRVVSGLVLLAFLPALLGILVPWAHIDYQGDGIVEPWRDAVEGTVDAIAWIAVLGLWLRPLARPLLAQYVIVGGLVALTVVPAAGATMLITIVFLAAVIAAYPRPRLLLDRTSTFANRALTVVAVLACAALMPIAFSAWSSSDASAATYAEHIAILGIAGVVAATTRPGWRWLAWSVAAAWAYLGVVALAIPHEADTFGRLGGVACVVVGCALTLAILRPVPRASAR